MIFIKKKLIQRIIKGCSLLVLMSNVTHIYAKDAAIAFETELSMEEAYQNNESLDEAMVLNPAQKDTSSAEQ